MTPELLTVISGVLLMLLIVLVAWSIGSVSHRHRDHGTAGCCGTKPKPPWKSNHEQHEVGQHQRRVDG